MSDSVKKYHELLEDGKIDNKPIKEHLDLRTLQYVRFSFNLYSDNSSDCLGYQHLLKKIEDLGGSTKLGDYSPYMKLDS